MIRVGIIGATGYTGAELVRILALHPEVKLTCLTSRQYAGRAYAEIYPAFAGLKGLTDLVCEEYDPAATPGKADIFFTALPHRLPMKLAPELLAAGGRVVDLSADFRFRSAALYESAYEPHTATDLLDEAVYGLCEIYEDAIRSARIVGNPGCYPTSVLLPLIPLLRKKLISASNIICDAKSGVSGAGRGLSLGTHFSEVNESFRAYKVAAHRHNPEINEQLGLAAETDLHVSFVPHLVPMTRGMLTTIYARPAGDVSVSEIRDCLLAAYEGRPFVRVRAEGQSPVTTHVRMTNTCDIGLFTDEAAGRLIIISIIDNLVKGASGQAVQNMNLMCGLPETTGLTALPAAL